MSSHSAMLRHVAITSTPQRNAVSEGMALGLGLCGRTSVPFDKVRVDLAFVGAWRGWTWRGQFPQVSTDLSKGLDGVWAMTRATEAKKAWILYWDTTGGELAIYTRQADWDSADEDDVSFALRVIDGDVPRDGWVSLAQEFLSRLER